MQVYPFNDELRRGIHSVLPLAGAWEGPAYRFTSLPYASRGDLVSGAGSRLNGGRWNPPGHFNCVYTSLDPHTALEESYAAMDKYGISRSKARPRVQVAITLRLQLVLDVTPSAILRKIGVTRSELNQIDWEEDQRAGRESLTQAIGRLAWLERLEGIIVPSSRAKGKNLVLFPGRRLRGSSWRISGARDLPPKD